MSKNIDYFSLCFIFTRQMEAKMKKNNYLDLYIMTLKKYFTFKGRANRTEFWSFYLLNFCLIFMLGLFSTIINPTNGQPDTELIYDPFIVTANLVMLFTFIPSISVAVRRLHDINKSGFNLLFGFIPYLGTLILFFFFLSKGTENENRFDIIDNKEYKTPEKNYGTLSQEELN